MRYSPDSFVVDETHDHRDNGDIVKGQEQCSKYLAQKFEQLNESELFSEAANKFFDLGDIKQSFEKSKQLSGMEYFLVNGEVEIKIFSFVSLLKPSQKNCRILTSLEKALLMQVNNLYGCFDAHYYNVLLQIYIDAILQQIRIQRMTSLFGHFIIDSNSQRLHYTVFFCFGCPDFWYNGSATHQDFQTLAFRKVLAYCRLFILYRLFSHIKYIYLLSSIILHQLAFVGFKGMGFLTLLLRLCFYLVNLTILFLLVIALIFKFYGFTFLIFLQTQILLCHLQFISTFSAIILNILFINVFLSISQNEIEGGYAEASQVNVEKYQIEQKYCKYNRYYRVCPHHAHLNYVILIQILNPKQSHTDDESDKANQREEYHQNKGFVIFIPDTIINPHAMMVKSLYASSTKLTMSRLRLYVTLTNFTVQSLKQNLLAMGNLRLIF